MCGFVGFTAVDFDEGVNRAIVKDMADRIIHRGPDDEGFFVNDDVAMGFRRLSIIDLEGSHQPMQNADGSVTVTVVPSPTADAMSSVPPCSTTISFAIARPSPAPPVALPRDESRRKNCSKMRPSFSGAMVRPRFFTRTTASVPRRSSVTSMAVPS